LVDARRYVPHVIGGSGVGVLEDAGLVRAVGDVVVGGVGLGLGLGDGDALLGGVVEEVVAALEAVEEEGVAPGGVRRKVWRRTLKAVLPRGDDLDGGVDGEVGELVRSVSCHDTGVGDN
jgi:hypothetical protein